MHSDLSGELGQGSAEVALLHAAVMQEGPGLLVQAHWTGNCHAQVLRGVLLDSSILYYIVLYIVNCHNIVLSIAIT